MIDLLEALEEWTMGESQKYRAEAYAAQMKDDKIRAATYIGREWAYISIAIKLREIRRGQEEATELLIPGIEMMLPTKKEN